MLNNVSESQKYFRACLPVTSPDFAPTEVHPSLVYLMGGLLAIIRECHSPDFALHNPGHAPAWAWIWSGLGQGTQ